MTVKELIAQLSALPEGCMDMEVKADCMLGPYLVAEGKTASALVDLNFGLEPEDSEEAVCLSPLCFALTGFVPVNREGEDRVVLELAFEHA